MLEICTNMGLEQTRTISHKNAPQFSLSRSDNFVAIIENEIICVFMKATLPDFYTG